MITKSIFSKKEMTPFIEETKYLEFITLLKKKIFKKAFKKILNLRGIFFIKGIYIIFLRFKNLIYEAIKSIF